jgi:hypothetical protein
MEKRSFTVEGREFTANGIGTFRHAFRDFRIRVCKHSDGTWRAEMATALNTYWHPDKFRSAACAARCAMDYWKDEIEEDERRAEADSDRERRDYERDNRLRRDDVL